MAANALDALQILAGLKRNASNPEGDIAARLQEEQDLKDMQRNTELAASAPKGTSVAGAVPSDIKDAQNTLDESPNFGVRAVKSQQGEEDALDFLRPGATAARNAETAAKVAVAGAPNEASARATIESEKLKSQNALDLLKQKQAGQRELIQGTQGGQPNAGGTNPNLQLSGVNAEGDPTFAVNKMPALLQRSHGQLSEARNSTLAALQEAERLYPGINDAAAANDTTTAAPSWMSILTGHGAPKYGSAADAAAAANDRAKYAVGVPTPFSKLAQEASFGNIEQMAGQLPGVRGLATIAPLFKEHQSRWGHETPLATVQRLRHMGSIMDEATQQMERDPNSAMIGARE